MHAFWRIGRDQYELRMFYVDEQIIFTALQPGSCCVEDRIAEVRDAIREHLHGESKKEPVEKIFNSARAQFRTCHFQRRPTAQLAMRFVYPLPCFFAVILNIFCCRQYPGDSFCFSLSSFESQSALLFRVVPGTIFNL